MSDTMSLIGNVLQNPTKEERRNDKNDETVQTRISKSMAEAGNKFIDQFKEEFDAYKSQSVKIAIIGRSGVGKSTFINKIRGLLRKDGTPIKLHAFPNCNNCNPCIFAQQGVTQTTMEVREYDFYPDAQDCLIKIYDLPGAGSKDFPINSYEEDVKMKEYDAFIMICDRLSETDITIWKKIKVLKKPVFIARSKSDLALESFFEDEMADNFTMESWKKKCDQVIKKECQGTLVDQNEKVYLISKKDCKTITINENREYVVEFPETEELINDILNGLGGIKREALLFRLTHKFKSISDLKEAELKKRIFKVALISAAGAAIPLPGISIFIDATMLVNEMSLQRKQFGLDMSSLRAMSELVGKPLDQFIDAIIEEGNDNPVVKKFNKELLTMDWKASTASAAFTNLALQASKLGPLMLASEASEDIVKFAVPIVGSFVAAAISGGLTYATLLMVLKTHRKLGSRMTDQLNEQVTKMA